ncbi:MAG: hypothetical protein GY842_16780 [bacterium]|nr:hypothetical protein [bacterium]
MMKPAPVHDRVAGGGAPALPSVFQPVDIAALLGIKRRALVNHARTLLAEAPLRVAGTLGFLLLIWVGLYGLFWLVFDYFMTTPLEAAVAIPLVFNFFFVALLVMLTISNAILAYSTLFRRAETAYLLTAPLAPRAVVMVTYLEVLFYSSWSLVLLGLPLMMAIADSTREPDLFYPLFGAFFMFFIPIPGAAGLVVAWLVARTLPRNLGKTVLFLLLGAILVGAVWGLRLIHRIEQQGGDWLGGFLFRMDFVQSALLPSTWITQGIDHAMHNRLTSAGMYLLLLLANALFLSWLAVRFTASRLSPAMDRASSGRSVAARLPAEASGGVLGAVFFYLPVPVRLIAVKDLRTFLRDPLQWTQLVILFGLMGLYLLNMPHFQIELLSDRWTLLVPLLNLAAVGFILATFTSRFVFPLVSMEGHQLWFIGLLPIKRSRLLHAKFAFAMTVSALVGVGSTALSAAVLKIALGWAVIHLAVTAATCAALCGFAVGIGARLPLFRQRDPARIASGFGGTVNLIASVALVSGVLAGFGVISWRAHLHSLAVTPDAVTWLSVLALVVLTTAAGFVAMRIGAAHLYRLEV